MHYAKWALTPRSVDLKLGCWHNFTSTLTLGFGVNACLAKCLNSVLNLEALECAFNQEKALIGAFSVIVKTDGSFEALVRSLHESVV